MKVLLLNPYITDFTAYDLWVRPLGLHYIAAVIRDYSDCEIFWLDALDRFQGPLEQPAAGDGRGKFHREIMEKPGIYKTVPRQYSRYGIPVDRFREKMEALPVIDVILVTTLMTYWIDGVKSCLNLLRDRFPGAKIVIGGILANLAPQEARLITGVDAVVQGRGEERILPLLEQLGARILPHPDFSEIDAIPPPAFDFAGTREHLPLLTSRGCPFRCDYCASPILNSVFAERSPEAIAAEISQTVEKYGTRNFIIFDDAFLLNKAKRLFRAFRSLDRRLGVRFHTPNGLHVREIDDETAETLHAARFETIRLGFESLSARILARSSGKVTRAEMEKALASLEKAGYARKEMEAYLLFGYPGQTVRDMEEALLFVADQGIIPRLSYYSPVPGTKDFSRLQKEGILASPLDLYETNKIYFLYEKSGFSISEIEGIKERTTKIAGRNSR
jgi:radical SAM superfamily enzyme YgiQ (UPF0313 family)